MDRVQAPEVRRPARDPSLRAHTRGAPTPRVVVRPVVCDARQGESEPQPFKAKRNVLHVANMNLTEPPEEVIAQLPTARMPFEFGVGLKAWKQPDGGIVLPTTTGAAEDGQQRGYPLRPCLLGEADEHVLDLGTIGSRCARAVPAPPRRPC